MWNTYSLLIGVKTCTAMIEINVGDPLESGNRFTSRSSYSERTLQPTTDTLGHSCSLM